MAFTSNSLNHAATQGTQGVQVNGYALSTDKGIADGVKAAIASQAGTNLAGGGTAASTGTAVTGTSTAFETDLVVGDLIYDAANPTEVREVTAIASDTSLTVDSAFTTDLSGSTVASKDTVYHVSVVEKLASFQGMCYFVESLRSDVPVAAEAEVISLEV